jgi:predicted phage terminase large subunit-like protein
VSNLAVRIDRLENEIAQRRASVANSRRSLSFGEWLDETSQPPFRWDAPHLIFIRQHLERVAAGEIRKLAIFVPPRHGKSEIATIRFPAWMLERDPRTRVIVGSYNATLAERFSRRTRRICASRIALSGERVAVCDWETSANGGLRAIGCGSGVTGVGANLIIVDDPVKSAEEAHSAAYRERVAQWYAHDLFTRREPGAAMVLIATRWHTDDLAGRILASDDAKEWVVVSLPALAEPNDPLGRAEGAPLWPERYDAAALEAIRQAIGGAAFASLYQQRPSAIEGAIFLREWFRYYRAPPAFDRIVASLDTAYKVKSSSDYSVCTVWGVARDGYYLLDMVRRRVEFPELKAIVATLGEQWKPNVLLIEDAGSGQSLVQELQRDSRLPVLPIKVDKDKVSRAYAVTPLIETGKVLLPETAPPWLGDFVDELVDFPNAPHDDVVDSVTMALAYLRGSPTGLLQYYERLLTADVQRAPEPFAFGDRDRLANIYATTRDRLRREH